MPGSCRKSPASPSGSSWPRRSFASAGSSTSTTLGAEGQWREDVPAEVLIARPRARAARRRAHRAQLPRPPLRRRDADRSLRRRRRRHRRPHPRHPQNDAGAAQAGEGGGRGGRRRELPVRPLRRDPDQGEPHRPRRGRRPAIDAARGATPTCDRDRGPRPRRDRRRARYRCRAPAARQHEPGEPAQGGPARDQNSGPARAKLEASGGVNLESVRDIARDRCRLHLHRRAHPLRAEPRPQPPT